MVYQTYSTDVNVEHVIRGNSVVIRCPIPSYVADYVTVESWLVDTTDIFADQWGTSCIPPCRSYPPYSAHPPPFTSSLRWNDVQDLFKWLELNDCSQDRMTGWWRTATGGCLLGPEAGWMDGAVRCGLVGTSCTRWTGIICESFGFVGHNFNDVNELGEMDSGVIEGGLVSQTDQTD